MHPVLFSIGSFPIHTYGVLIATGFLTAIWVLRREAVRVGISGEAMVDLGFWSLLVGMLGSRVLFILTRLDYFPDHLIEMFYVWEGGLVFWGGPLTCIPFFIWYTKRHKIPLLTALDLAGVVVPLAHAFGRLGCLAAGCCHGRPTEGQWGIKLYSELVEPSLRGVYLHPTQAYESFCLFLLFIVLFRLNRVKKFDGQIAVTYLASYSLIRSIIEVFRGDSIRGFVIPGILSTSQFISILVIIGAIFAARSLWKRKLAS